LNFGRISVALRGNPGEKSASPVRV
jgi:hypothetical protein